MATWSTLEEAAKHPTIGKSTIHRLACEGDVPVHTCGRVWRFDAEELDESLKQGRMVELSANEDENGKETQTS